MASGVSFDLTTVFTLRTHRPFFDDFRPRSFIEVTRLPPSKGSAGEASLMLVLTVLAVCLTHLFSSVCVCVSTLIHINLCRCTNLQWVVWRWLGGCGFVLLPSSQERGCATSPASSTLCSHRVDNGCPRGNEGSRWKLLSTRWDVKPGGPQLSQGCVGHPCFKTTKQNSPQTS